jgi:Acetyl xylan esterase (AXE1)
MEVALKRSGRGLLGWKPAAIALAAGVVALAVPTAANAEITSVFSDTATPVDCTIQTVPNEGIRFCSESPRSTVKTFDGVPIDVNVAFPPEPEAGPDGPYPTVMMFHGYGGSKLGLAQMRRWLDQGYATFSMTTRGFHQSCGTAASREADPAGCAAGYVRLMDTRYEVRDAQELIGKLVDEGLVDPGAIGATGGSYGGGMSMALAALRDRVMLPDGSLTAWESPAGTPLEIAAAAPQVPWTDLAYSLVPNGGLYDYVADAPYFGATDRIGVQKQSYVNLLYLGGLANGIYAPEGSDPAADLTGWKNMLDTGGPYGPEALEVVEEITRHHSSYYIDDSVAPAPLLISIGFTDDLFPANEAARFYNRTLTTYPDADIALTFGDFGHPRGQGQAQTNQYIAAREDAWMAHYVLGEGAEPQAGVDALTQACGAPPAGPFHGDSLATLAPGEIRFESPQATTIGVSGTAYGDDFASPASNSCKTVPAGDSPAGAIYRLDAAPTGGYTLLGSPTVVARIDAPGDNTQIAARLMDIAPNGDQKLIARGLWRPEIGGPSRQVFQLNPNAWEFEEGHVAKLELLPDDAPFGRASPGQRPVEVSNLELRLPVAEPPGALGGLVAEPAEKILRAELQLAPGFDSGPPATRVLERPPLRSRDTTPRFDFLSSDVGSTYECRLDSADEEDWFECERGIERGIARGDHAFEVRAIDPDLNADPTPAVVRFEIDRTRPKTNTRIRATRKRVVVTASSNEPGTRFECSRGKGWHRCKAKKRFKLPLDHPVTYRVRAVDSVGNRDRTPERIRLR